MAMQSNPEEASAPSVPRPVPSPADRLSIQTFRELFVSLDLHPEEHPVIGITSTIEGEGCTTVAWGLARTLAADLDSLVSLVEVDFERPSLSAQLNLSNAPGLADVIRGEAHLADVQYQVAPNLCLIPAGTTPGDPGRLLHQFPINDPFHSQIRLDGLVILDLPPLLSHGYSALAAKVADALLLVVRAGVTPVDLVRQAIGRLEDQPLRGIVLNGFERPRLALLPRRRR
jgi:non-specific protein-tyrosine kinase